MSRETLTPMMKQYHRIKKDYRDALLFFRLGDFYEMFYEDAKTASSVLEIALTSRQKVPMCGVPYHAAESYLAKLLRRGFKVAICEQVEDARQARGVVKRDVVRVLTPGTAVELEPETSKESLRVGSLCLQDEGWGLAVVDLEAGQIRTTEGEDRAFLSDELFRASPREIIFSSEQAAEVESLLAKNDLAEVARSPQEDWIFELHQARSLLQDHFQVSSLAGFGLEEKTMAVAAAGALLFYLRGLRKDALSLVHGLSFRPLSLEMVLDATTIRNLELTRNLRDSRLKGSLLDIIDFTVTAAGGRRLRFWLLHPALDCGEIAARLDAVEEFLSHTIERQELRAILKETADVERLAGKIALGAATARDLVALKRSLALLPDIQGLVRNLDSRRIKELLKDWDEGRDIVELLDQAILEEPSHLITEGGMIREGYSQEIDELRKISHSGKTIISQMEQKERERTGIPSLKIRYNKVFGYYIDVTRPNLSLVPPDYIRKQTLVNSERFITPELKEYEEKVLNAEEKIKQLEYRLFLEVREKVSSQKRRLMDIASRLASLDVLSALAELAAQRGYHRPVVDQEDRIEIKEGRHPVIEMTQEEPFIPNDTYLDRDSDQILIVTGPNMGGKSTYLRQVALICILAQMGSFVPAREAKIGIVDRIFTRIGAMDFLSVGQSTFMVEMLETANILHNATPRSLILLDEIGRGTSTFDGLSIAWAVAEYLHEKEDIRPKTLFATHYHELTELSLTLERIKNYHVSVKEWKEDVIFLRKIVPGPSDQSYGIHVARLAGIPRSVIERAKQVLFNLETKELDQEGRPRIAYDSRRKRDQDQLLLFEEDRERALLEDMKEEIEALDINTLPPLEALNWISEWKEKLRKKKRGGS